jgi:hypothetical protein
MDSRDEVHASLRASQKRQGLIGIGHAKRAGDHPDSHEQGEKEIRKITKRGLAAPYR